MTVNHTFRSIVSSFCLVASITTSVATAETRAGQEANGSSPQQKESADKKIEREIAALLADLSEHAKSFNVQAIEKSMLAEGQATYSAEIIWATQDFIQGTPPELQGGNYKKIKAVCEKYGMDKFRSKWPDDDATAEENRAFDKKLFKSLGPDSQRVRMLSELLKVSADRILYISPFEGVVDSVEVRGKLALVRLANSEDWDDDEDVWIHKFVKTKTGWKWEGYDWAAMEEDGDRPLLKRVDFTGSSVAGQHVALEDFRGKYVLVDFWATWCAPCVAELPTLRRLHASLNAEEFVIVGVAADDKATLKQFSAKHELPWHNIVDADSEIAKSLGIDEYPTTLLINPQGQHVAWNLFGADLIEELSTSLNLKAKEKDELQQIAKDLVKSAGPPQETDLSDASDEDRHVVLLDSDKAGFKAADVDGNRKLELIELTPYLRSRYQDGILPTREIFTRLDKNKNSVISLPEFAELDSAISHFMGGDYLDFMGMPDPSDPGVGYVFFRGLDHPIDDRAIYGAAFHRSRELSRANRDAPNVDLKSVPTVLPGSRPAANSATLDQDRSIEDLVRSTIVIAGGHPDFYSMGGVIISPDGLALTNYHVAESLKDHQLVGFTSDGKPHRVVEFLAGDPDRDIALIRLQGSGFPSARIGADAPKMGDDIVVLHHSENRYFTYDRGHVMRFPRLGNNTWMEISSDYAPGGSGCGIYNQQHELIGLVSNIAYGDGPSLANYVENNAEDKSSTFDYGRAAGADEFGAIRVKHAVSLDSIHGLWSRGRDDSSDTK